MRRYKTKRPTPWGVGISLLSRAPHWAPRIELSCPRRIVQGYSGKGLFLLLWLSPQELLK